MKRMMWAFILAASTAAAFAQDTSLQELKKLDADWNVLRLKGDARALGALLADDWMLTHSDGRVQSKADYLQELATKSRTNSQIENVDVQVRPYRETAVITGTSVQSGVSDGKPWQGKFRFTRVWVHLPERWVMVSSHSSRIAP